MRKLILAAIAALTLSTAAVAGPFEDANAYYGAKYGVPDFTFTKAEFGNTNLGRLIHLGAEVVVEAIAGATVVYNPATQAVDVYVTGSEFKGRTLFATDRCLLLSGKTALGVAGADGICLPADTQVGNAGGLGYSHTNPAINRSCSFDAGKDGVDVHSC